ncbi:MAG: HlyD family efflux transporter periplasmic adaptor subunit, partial [Gammaproteobacteria bacterium]|nr:HlyD family efflux transporter periplasmic adaptor subunit [Gammaproteobacteria bacterium]
EYREAMAERDRAKTAVLQAQLRQAEAQLDLIDAQLARTRVAAPFAGLVIDGDLSQSLGAPVERGSVLFKIAPLSGYRVVLQVDETDVAEVAAGQQGRLSLASLPGRTFPITIEQVTPVAEAADGHNRFRVEARLDESAEALRPGMEGVGKIAIGERRYGWLLTHRLVDWLTLKLWSLSL